MSPVSPGSHSTTLHYGKLIVMRQTFILGAEISSFGETFGLHVQVKVESAWIPKVLCHISLSCTLVYPNCSALSLNTEGSIGSLTPGGGPLCGVLEHHVQLLRAPGGQICQEVAVQSAEKAAQRVALLADRESGVSGGPRHGEAACAQRPALSLVSRPSARQLPITGMYL